MRVDRSTVVYLRGSICVVAIGSTVALSQVDLEKGEDASG